MWNNSLQTLLVGTIMAVGVSLSGCDSSKDDAQNQDADMSEQTVADDALVQDNATPNADLDGATAQQGTQVKYDVAGWGTKNVASLTVDNLDEIKATFGKVMSTRREQPRLSQ